MEHMIQGHEQVIQKFKSEEGQTQARPVEAVVAGALPILQQHLALAQGVQSGIKNQASGTVGSTNKRN
jgi:hypothetical protein